MWAVLVCRKGSLPGNHRIGRRFPVIANMMIIRMTNAAIQNLHPHIVRTCHPALKDHKKFMKIVRHQLITDQPSYYTEIEQDYRLWNDIEFPRIQTTKSETFRKYVGSFFHAFSATCLRENLKGARWPDVSWAAHPNTSCTLSADSPIFKTPLQAWPKKKKKTKKTSARRSDQFTTTKTFERFFVGRNRLLNTQPLKYSRGWILRWLSYATNTSGSTLAFIWHWWMLAWG